MNVKSVTLKCLNVNLAIAKENKIINSDTLMRRDTGIHTGCFI